MITMGFWLLKLLVAAHTVYFLHEIRRNGMLELLLGDAGGRGADVERAHCGGARGVSLALSGVGSVLEVSFGIGVKVAQGGDWPSSGDDRPGGRICQRSFRP
jgi:hypothetical protein